MFTKKFESFSRVLLTKMRVEFTNRGLEVSSDDGVDGRVVIQCNRNNVELITESDINQFLGTTSKFQADYGVFMTNRHFK